MLRVVGDPYQVVALDVVFHQMWAMMPCYLREKTPVKNLQGDLDYGE
jgi:hypothetical protein